METSEEWIIYL